MAFLSSKLGLWTRATAFGDLPEDVVESTRFRVLDVIGLALAGLGTGFGQPVRTAALALAPDGPARVLGTGERAFDEG